MLSSGVRIRHTVTDAYLIERIQRRFLGFASLLLFIPHLIHDYSSIAKYLELDILIDRRVALNTKFLKNLCKFDSSSLLYLFNFVSKDRFPPIGAPFFIYFCSTNYTYQINHLL